MSSSTVLIRCLNSHHAFRKLLLGAGIASKLSATDFKDPSSLLNLIDVVDVINMNSPLPTIDAEIKAFRSLIKRSITSVQYILKSQ